MWQRTFSIFLISVMLIVWGSDGLARSRKVKRKRYPPIPTSVVIQEPQSRFDDVTNDESFNRNYTREETNRPKYVPFKRPIPYERPIPKEDRVALIIGNDNYQHTVSLKKAVNDANSVFQELIKRKFHIIYKSDAGKQTMETAIKEFLEHIGTNTFAFVFYAGHGVNIDGTNYLLPTDTSNDFINYGIDLDKLLQKVSHKQAKLSFAVIDACRNNPTLESTNTREFSYPDDINYNATRNFSSINTRNVVTGSVVMYSAATGQTALDRLGEDDESENGVFTRVFVDAIKKPGCKLIDIVRFVEKRVTKLAKTIGHEQIPAVSKDVTGEFFFIPGSHCSLDDVVPSDDEVSEEKTKNNNEDVDWGGGGTFGG